jgi:hypothetical protein
VLEIAHDSMTNGTHTAVQRTADKILKVFYMPINARSKGIVLRVWFASVYVRNALTRELTIRFR